MPEGAPPNDGAHRAAFFVEPDEAMLRVEIFGRQGQGAPAPAGGLGVQPQQQRVQCRVIPCGSGARPSGWPTAVLSVAGSCTRLVR